MTTRERLLEMLEPGESKGFQTRALVSIDEKGNIEVLDVMEIIGLSGLTAVCFVEQSSPEVTDAQIEEAVKEWRKTHEAVRRWLHAPEDEEN